MTWLPTVSGLPVDLVAPSVHEVDFAEIAHALAHINRSAGNSEQPVSVALHTLIGVDLCQTPTLAAKWLLHDAHEARLGDETSPHKEATRAVAHEVYGAEAVAIVDGVRRELERRHDAVIFKAAGLRLPDAMEREALKLLDLRALATERRDFYRRGPAPRRWHIDDLGILPGPKVWGWKPPAEVARQLLTAFRTYLPALAQGRRAS